MSAMFKAQETSLFQVSSSICPAFHTSSRVPSGVQVMLLPSSTFIIAACSVAHERLEFLQWEKKVLSSPRRRSEKEKREMGMHAFKRDVSIWCCRSFVRCGVVRNAEVTIDLDVLRTANDSVGPSLSGATSISSPTPAPPVAVRRQRGNTCRGSSSCFGSLWPRRASWQMLRLRHAKVRTWARTQNYM